MINRVKEDAKAMRERIVRKLCEVENEEKFESIMKTSKSFLRNKTREILIMGGNYEELNKETSEVVVKVMIKLKETLTKAQKALEEKIIFDYLILDKKKKA